MGGFPVYIEETGGTDGDIKVSVDGDEYTAEATSDLNNDGIEDTAMVSTDDGYLSFTDTDNDGRADLMRTLNEKGDVVGSAKFDGATGEWVSDQKGGGRLPDERQGLYGAGSGMVVHGPDGDHRVEGQLVDTNNDGKGDTVTVTDAQGNSVIYADTDADGDAELSTTITKDGQVIVKENTKGGDWVVVDQEKLGAVGDGEVQTATTAEEAESSDSGWGLNEEAEPVERPSENKTIKVDPKSGQWIGDTGLPPNAPSPQEPRWK
ncbi:hypothetical protein SAMN04489726_5690 [Allokutzneria albata]|uniref:DUF6802 domain-containing protein n=1 Tax=Allokutzneria albata TaxID=211114 RepID=A0A1G9ZUQ9_ALLAB|nr:hypothetical protein SAMN04489726_5690 [Allokutzneria albata]